MITEAKAVKNQHLCDFCQTIKLSASNSNEARFLARMLDVLSDGGKIKLENEKGKWVADYVQPPPKI